MTPDLFAGPGGWDHAARELGLDVTGIELDPATCATRAAAALPTIAGSVLDVDPLEFAGADGLLASPPCQGFSKAGRGRGMNDRELLLDAARNTRSPADVADAIAKLHANMQDDRSVLALEPLRWALTISPRWMAWEQVPTVLPIWEACAIPLRRAGYSVATGLLAAECYGVPQTRRRAILIARRLGAARMPRPTHSRFHDRRPDVLDRHVAPWVTIAEALGMDPELPIELSSTTRPNSPRRRLSQPAQTMAFGNDAASCAFVPVGADVREAKATGTAERITIEQAATLQTFPADYPWRGPKASRYRQVGNAVPPLLARAILAHLTS